MSTSDSDQFDFGESRDKMTIPPNFVLHLLISKNPLSLSIQWNDWVSNCTMSNINFGKTFPYDIPSTTTLPNWAYANNARGAFDMGDACVQRFAAVLISDLLTARFCVNAQVPTYVKQFV